jgi:hypothetical protein
VNEKKRQASANLLPRTQMPVFYLLPSIIQELTYHIIDAFPTFDLLALLYLLPRKE